MTGNVASWTNADVQRWLAGLGLPEETLAIFAKNSIDGGVLTTLSDDDLPRQLGCPELQARKIRQHLMQLGVPPPPASAAPSCSPAAASLAAEPSPSAPPLLTPAVGGQQEPDPHTCFQPDDLQRYQNLRDHSAKLQDLQPAAKVSQAEKYLGSVEQQLGAAQAALAPTLKALAKQQKRIAKYKGERFYLGKVFTTKHHRAVKLSESQDKAECLIGQQHEQERVIRVKQAEREEAQCQLAVWQATASELAGTQQQLMELVERMFSSPAWRASPRQTELVEALQALEAQSAEAKRGHDTYGRAVKLLTESTRLLKSAVQNLQDTQNLSMMELGLGLGGSVSKPANLFVDLAQMVNVNEANGQVSQAAAKTHEARKLLEGLPQVNESAVSDAKMGVFTEMFIGGGIGGDLFEMSMVKRSKQQVEKMLGQVKAAAGWAEANLAVYEKQEAALKAQAAAKKGELEAFREVALQAALGD